MVHDMKTLLEELDMAGISHLLGSCSMRLAKQSVVCVAI